MTMKSFSLGAIAFGVMIWTGACAKETPTAPSIVSGDVSGGRTADVTSSPTVTLLPDLTASPSEVTVQAGDTVLVRLGQYDEKVVLDKSVYVVAEDNTELGDVLVRDVVEVLHQGANAVAVGGNQEPLADLVLNTNNAPNANNTAL